MKKGELLGTHCLNNKFLFILVFIIYSKFFWFLIIVKNLEIMFNRTQLVKYLQTFGLQTKCSKIQVHFHLKFKIGFIIIESITKGIRLIIRYVTNC